MTKVCYRDIKPVRTSNFAIPSSFIQLPTSAFPYRYF